jgi:WD40 repeat protein
MCADDDLPSDAVKRIKQFQAEAEAIRNKADAEVNARHDKLIADLENLKKEYTKAGKLDEAVAIRDCIRQLKEKPEPVGEVRRFEGHEAPVLALAFSPDGRLAVSGTAGGENASTIRLWDVRTGNKLRNLDGHRHNVNAVAFSPDGKRVLSCSQDNTVRLWNAETGKKVKRLVGHSAPVLDVVFSPDGKRAARTRSCGSGTWKVVRSSSNWWDTTTVSRESPFPRTAAGHFPAATTRTRASASGTSNPVRF